MMLAKIFGPLYLVAGLSFLLYAKPWTEVMKKWRKDHLALIPFAFMGLLFGLVVVNIHNVWEWTPNLLITLIGWIMILKGAFFLLMPGKCTKQKLEMMEGNVALMYVSGVFAAALGLVLCYYAFYV